VALGQPDKSSTAKPSEAKPSAAQHSEVKWKESTMIPYNPVEQVMKMLQEPLQRESRQGQEPQRQRARLAVIINDFLALGCPLHGADKCRTQAQCMADEIVSRAIAWE